MPASNDMEFDAQLIRSIQSLRDLRKTLNIDVFISYCAQDFNNDSVLFDAITSTLERSGYKW